jgi:CheY-like chemotaxis protein
MIEPQALKRAISLEFPSFAVPCFINADRTRVKQVLVNLLSNAVKYNREGGAVVVEYVVGDGKQAAGPIRICIRDTGEGLDADKLAQLFQPFNRLGQEENVGEGTGIGLVVCKRLTELMGGVIGVESTVGSGSVFWVELPRSSEPHLVAEPAQRSIATPKQSAANAQARTLLYIEDNPANLMLVEDLVERRADIRLLTARAAAEGIEIARNALPDVILMDINLPGISGLEALKVLAETVSTAHIPVIALSANAVPRDMQRGLDAGFFRYLTKPIKVNEFMETLDVAFKFAATRASHAKGDKQT